MRNLLRTLFLMALVGVAATGALAQGSAPAPAPLPLVNPNPTAEETSADRLYTARDWPAAAAAYEAITKATPANARAWFQWGAALHEAGDFSRAAAAHLQAAARGFSPSALANFRAVRALTRAGNLNGAFATLDAMLTAGFANTQALETHADLAALRADPRFAEGQRRVRANADPCNSTPGYRQMDFWVGTWEVQTTGTPKGTPGAAKNVIEKVLNGCALWENWEPPPAIGHGKGLHVFNFTLEKWEQHWVTASGSVVNFYGEFKDGKMRYTTEPTLPNGTKATRVTTIYPIDKDTVRQHGDQTTDGGKTWTPVFDLTYYRVN